MNTTNKVLIAIAVGGGAYLAYNYYQNEQAKKVIGTGTGITENSRTKIEDDIVKQYVEESKKKGQVNLEKLARLKIGLASFTLSDLQKFNDAFSYLIQSANVPEPHHLGENKLKYEALKNKYEAGIYLLSESGMKIFGTMNLD